MMKMRAKINEIWDLIDDSGHKVILHIFIGFFP